MVRFEEVLLKPLKKNINSSYVIKANEVIYRFLKRGYTPEAYRTIKEKLTRLIDRMTKEDLKNESQEELQEMLKKVAYQAYQVNADARNQISARKSVGYALFSLIEARNRGDFNFFPYEYFEILKETWNGYGAYCTKEKIKIFKDLKDDLIRIMNKDNKAIL